MRAMVQTRKHRELTVALRQTSAVLGAISGIAGILSCIPGPIGWVAYGISVVSSIAVAAIDCSENLASFVCGVDIVSAALGAVVKPIDWLIRDRGFYKIQALNNGVGLAVSATSFSLSGYGYRESRFNP
jgi:hypothetical protein